MKKIKAINGYTIYEATKKDENKYNVEEGYFYIYFSSDIRDYGISNSEWDWEAGSIEEATEWATGSNYAIAKEIVEEILLMKSEANILFVRHCAVSGFNFFFCDHIQSGRICQIFEIQTSLLVKDTLTSILGSVSLLSCNVIIATNGDR